MHESYKKWLEDGCPKVFCGCPCHDEIIITKNHKWNGIPKYMNCHSPNMKIWKSGNIPWNKGLVGVQASHIPWNKGVPQTEEHTRKISEANKNQIPWIKGKNHSEETREKMRKSHENTIISEEQKIKLREYCGDKHWNWQGGISKSSYCEKWTEELREEIRERDNRICQLCDITELENIRKLAVHHIHYDKPNCDPDLIALCTKCSSKVNFNKDYWEEFFMRILKYRDLLKG